MDNPDQIYEKLLREVSDNSQALGLIVGGSRGKDKTFLTEYSDYDIYIILADDATEESRRYFEVYKSPEIDIWVKTLSELREHARWGTIYDWDRYNYAHNKPVVDKTGELKRIIEEKGSLPGEVQRDFIETSLKSYINHVYRSAKYWREGNEFPALLDASESLPYLMDALFALDGRVKPYNKYLEWELRNYPLPLFPWRVDEFVANYRMIITTGDIQAQERIYAGAKKLFQDHGYTKPFDRRQGQYFVG